MKTLVELPTLEGLAWNLCGSDRLVCPLMDARCAFCVFAGVQ